MTRWPYRLPTPVDGVKIGLFGGSFDPAHYGHHHVAEVALKRLQLDYVWWIPAAGNPLKSTETPFERRMISALVMANNPRMAVTDLEPRLGVRYTADLVAKLRATAPRAQFVWLMGGDNLFTFHHWQKWNEIARSLPIAVVSRPGAGPKARFSKFSRRYASARKPAYAANKLPCAEAPAWVHLRAPLNWENSTRLRLEAETTT
ncbi:MAG: nicotinate-nucleotide adenylyltransferase [Pseudomonadota bacterium]